MSKLELKLLGGRLQDTFSNHSCVALLLLGSHILIRCIRTCILIVGLINVHRLVLILSTDFALDFVFLSRITLQFHQALPQPSRSSLLRLMPRPPRPVPSLPLTSATVRSRCRTMPDGTACRPRRSSLARLGSGGRSVEGTAGVA